MRSLIAANTQFLIRGNGLKQKTVAQKAGYSEKQFSAMMNGRKIITAIDIANIALALNVTPNELFAAPETTADRSSEGGRAS